MRFTVCLLEVRIDTSFAITAYLDKRLLQLHVFIFELELHMIVHLAGGD